MPQNNSTNFVGVNKYTVSSSASNGSYNTIQSAINSASASGGGTVFILPGTYVESLTIPGGVSLTGVTDLGESNVIIAGNATITNTTGTTSFENLLLAASSGTTLAISTNTSATTVISINACTISNTSSSGICVSSTTTSTGNPIVSIVNCNVQSSGTGVKTNGTQSLNVGYSLVAGNTLGAVDLTGATNASLFWDNLQSSGSNVCIIRSTTTVASIAQCVGTSSTEVVNFVAAGTAGVSNSSFLCSAASTNWATGTGALSYTTVSIIGSAQNISSSTIKVPTYSWPRAFLPAVAITANRALLPNYAYYVTSGALSLSLPSSSSSSVGDVIQVSLAGGTSWTITQASGQQITFGTLSTISGALGSLSTVTAGSSATISYFSSGKWIVTSSVGVLVVV